MIGFAHLKTLELLFIAEDALKRAQLYAVASQKDDVDKARSYLDIDRLIQEVAALRQNLEIK